MKYGQKVKCINPSLADPRMQKGAIYTIRESYVSLVNGPMVRVEGFALAFYAHRFEPIEEEPPKPYVEPSGYTEEVVE